MKQVNYSSVYMLACIALHVQTRFFTGFVIMHNKIYDCTYLCLLQCSYLPQILPSNIFIEKIGAKKNLYIIFQIKPDVEEIEAFSTFFYTYIKVIYFYYFSFSSMV